MYLFGLVCMEVQCLEGEEAIGKRIHLRYSFLQKEPVFFMEYCVALKITFIAPFCATAYFIKNVLGVYTRSMETIYLSLVHTGS